MSVAPVAATASSVSVAPVSVAPVSSVSVPATASAAPPGPGGTGVPTAAGSGVPAASVPVGIRSRPRCGRPPRSRRTARRRWRIRLGCPSSQASQPVPTRDPAGRPPRTASPPAGPTRGRSRPPGWHTVRYGCPVHLHHARPEALLPTRPRGPEGDQPLLLSRRQDRRHRWQRVGQVLPAQDHGGPGRRLHGRGPPHARLHRRLPVPGARARPHQGRPREHLGRGGRGQGHGRPLQRGVRRLRGAGRRLRQAARRAGRTAGQASTPPAPGTSNAPSRSPWTRCAAPRATPT